MNVEDRRTLVMFVGGELDGKVYACPELKPRYRAPYMRHSPHSFGGGDFTGKDFPSNAAPPDIKHTEYVLTKKDSAFYYVERELFELSNQQGIDPRPL